MFEIKEEDEHIYVMDDGVSVYSAIDFDKVLVSTEKALELAEYCCEELNEAFYYGRKK